jgi:hypothetical protein
MNKPRLIDANKLLSYLNDWWLSETPSGEVLFINGVPQRTAAMTFIEHLMKVVESQPTAYDIDKVVEQLEALPNINQNYHSSTEMIDREDAIEIVKDQFRDNTKMVDRKGGME